MPRAPGTGCIHRKPKSKLYWCAFWVHGKRYQEATGTTVYEKAEDYMRTRIAILSNPPPDAVPMRERTILEMLLLVIPPLSDEEFWRSRDGLVLRGFLGLAGSRPWSEASDARMAYICARAQESEALYDPAQIYKDAATIRRFFCRVWFRRLPGRVPATPLP